MVEMTVAEFEKIVAKAMDNIPKSYSLHMDNVGFVIEDLPSAEQAQKLHLYNGKTLFGLYEGVPLTKRGSGYSGVLPDKITIFRLPILFLSKDHKSVVDQVNNTVWHEVAHHFGLDHDRIGKLEDRRPR
jgi:predicted Zn-dependent protease with MMP-like domain